MAPATTINLTLLLLAAAAINASTPPPTREEVEAVCPSQCSCTLFSGRVQADCASKSLSNIPAPFHVATNTLLFDDNVLLTLGSDSFPHLHHLRDFYCSRCQLENIEDDAFRGLSSLKYIDLSSNKFTTISTVPFTRLDRLRVLIVTDNDGLDCDIVQRDFHDLSPRVRVLCRSGKARTRRTAIEDEESAFIDDLFNSTRNVESTFNETTRNNTRSDSSGDWIPVDTPDDPSGWGAGTFVVLAILVVIICLVCFKFVFLRLRKRYKRRAREAAWRAEAEEEEDDDE